MRGRGVAWGLIVYGVLGLLLVVSGAVLGLEVAGRIERLASAADGTLAAAARSTRAAADSFTSVDASLSDAETSIGQAATLSRDAGATLDALSAAMELSVFGAQPLLPLAGQFATSADQAEELAGTLVAAGGSLSDTRTDVAAIGIELESLSRELEGLGTSAAADDAAPPLRLFVALLLAWIAVPAVGALVVGTAMLRRRRAAT